MGQTALDNLVMAPSGTQGFQMTTTKEDELMKHTVGNGSELALGLEHFLTKR